MFEFLSTETSFFSVAKGKPRETRRIFGWVFFFSLKGRVLTKWFFCDILVVKEIEFLYNADGIRTSKTVNNVKHDYTLNGIQIVSEAWSGTLFVHLYDESGLPIGMMAVSCSSRKRGFVLLSSYPHYSVASRNFCSERPFVGFRVPILRMKGK
ncbi:MAG: hypothetical protein IKC59_07755 [Clostridia bacterium]|nr:hypothetical protein [Clostridia bacterium]